MLLLEQNYHVPENILSLDVSGEAISKQSRSRLQRGQLPGSSLWSKVLFVAFSLHQNLQLRLDDKFIDTVAVASAVRLADTSAH
jgi:hypothetical protein